MGGSDGRECRQTLPCHATPSIQDEAALKRHHKKKIDARHGARPDRSRRTTRDTSETPQLGPY